VYRYLQSKPVAAEEIKVRDTVFTGGEQGFLGLKLSDIEILSDNTKRYRFEFPDKEAVSGLHVACKFPRVISEIQSDEY
jgi:cytochrome-b5 reductase